MAFKPATKMQSRLKAALVGPSGSGKTFTALSIAKGIGGRVAVIDTERGSASKYADLFQFEVDELESYHPQKFIDALHLAEKLGFGVVIIDSLSHAWNGKDGTLEQVDRITAASRSKNNFNAWSDAGPLQNAMVDAILRSSCHVIVTMRVKTEWVVEKDEKGRSVPRKIGLAPVQKAGLEYEFDVIGELDDAILTVTKTRCRAVHKAIIKDPGEDLGRTLAAWLGEGAPVMAETDPMDAPAPVAAPVPKPAQPQLALVQPKPASPVIFNKLMALIQEARTEVDLMKAGQACKDARKEQHISDRERMLLGNVYLARQKELSQSRNEGMAQRR